MTNKEVLEIWIRNVGSLDSLQEETNVLLFAAYLKDALIPKYHVVVPKKPNDDMVEYTMRLQSKKGPLGRSDVEATWMFMIDAAIHPVKDK